MLGIAASVVTVTAGIALLGSTTSQNQVPGNKAISSASAQTSSARRVTVAMAADSSQSTAARSSSKSSAAVTLTFRPHCVEKNQKKCGFYDVSSPLTLQTPPFAIGSTLDMDIVAYNSAALPVQKIRSWLQYDPDILEGIAVKPLSQLPLTTPGEFDFQPAKGYVMIQTEIAKATTGSILGVAEVQFRAKKIPAGNKSALSFYDMDGTPPHTAAYTADATPRNILTSTLGSLVAYVLGTPDTPSASSEAAISNAHSSAAAEMSSSSVTSQAISSSSVSSSDEALHGAASSTGTMNRSTFVLLQVQNVRVTSEGTTLYASWDALPAPNLKGYTVYYGTETGRYIQRRTIQPDTTAIAIRSLPEGTTYFVAVRGLDDTNEESAFSQEVSVTIGDPATSTAPLQSSNIPTGPQGKNPLQKVGTGKTSVPGASGLSSTASLLLLASAVIGTLYAFRRQFTASTPQL